DPPDRRRAAARRPDPARDRGPDHPGGPRGGVRRQAHLPRPDRRAARHQVGAADPPHAGAGARTPRHLHPPDRKAAGAAHGAATTLAHRRLRPRRGHGSHGTPRRHGLHRCGGGSNRRTLRRAGSRPGRRRGGAARPHRQVPRRRTGAPRHRPGERGGADAGLPAALRGDQGRLQGGYQGERTGV
ncbi:MAG: 2-polyprenyl-3-methyl-6-methoxy-1,4-benzoquinol hydroxylase, coq7 type, partial [uncultured Acetobacteraceae bacterium]